MTLREYLEAHGASKQQLSSQTLEMCEEAMLSESGIIDETATATLKRKTDEIKKAEWEVKNYSAALSNLKSEISSTKREMSELRYNLAEIKTGISEIDINDETLKDAVRAYSQILQITKDAYVGMVGGVPDEVMIEAIRAGSYAVWQGIRGPLYKDEKNNRGRVRI